MAKKIEVISSKVKNLDKTTNLVSYLNKKVYSSSGELVGIIYDVLIEKGRFIGFLVKGKRKMFIDKNFIQKESDKALVLNTDPVFNLLGKIVYDSAGKKVGKVSNLNRKSNANVYSELMVKTAIYKKAVPIDKKDIRVAKKNIILRKVYGKEQ